MAPLGLPIQLNTDLPVDSQFNLCSLWMLVLGLSPTGRARDEQWHRNQVSLGPLVEEGWKVVKMIRAGWR